MVNLIMMHGHPLSGKSTTAKIIKDFYTNKGEDYVIIKSTVERYKGKPVKFTKECVDERIEKTRKEKDECYKDVCSRAEKEILKSKNVILDATFHKKYRRQWVYDLVKKYNTNFVIIWLVLDNEELIKNYLEKRRNDPDFKDNILSTWNQYSIMVEQFDGLQDDELKNKIIVVDRDGNEIRFIGCDKSDVLVKEIFGVINLKVLEY